MGSVAKFEISLRLGMLQGMTQTAKQQSWISRAASLSGTSSFGVCVVRPHVHAAIFTSPHATTHHGVRSSNVGRAEESVFDKFSIQICESANNVAIRSFLPPLSFLGKSFFIHLLKIAQRKMPYIRRSNYYGGVKQHSIQNNRPFTYPVELLRRPFKNTHRAASGHGS